MGDVPAATPFPLPSFDGLDGHASFEQFLDFLRTLISQYLSDNISYIPGSNKDVWVTIINGMTEHLLTSFPLPDCGSWNDMRNKVVLVDMTLEVIKRVFERVEGIYQGTSEMMKEVYARLLSLCLMLDFWLDVIAQPEGDLISPGLLREKSFQLLVSLLRGLGNNMLSSAGAVDTSWKTLRMMLTECLDACQDLTSETANFNYPLRLKLFHKPRLSGADSELSVANLSDTFSIPLPSVSFAPPFLNITFQLCCCVIAPPLLSQWFIRDIIRRVVACSGDILRFCFLSSCSISISRRASIALCILNSSIDLQALPDCGDTLGHILVFFLHYRLNEGPKDEWIQFDQILTQVLENKPFKLVLRNEAVYVMTVLCSETWSLQGNILRDLGCTFLRGVLKTADDEVTETLLAELNLLRGLPNSETVYKLFQDAISRRNSDRPVNYSSNAGGTGRVTRIIQEILSQDKFNRMDGDSEWSQNHIEQVLNAIQKRFERPLNDSSEAGRFGLATNLIQLPCQIFRCGGNNNGICMARFPTSFVQAYTVVAVRLLEGSENEVTATVRRKVFQVLEHAIKHHDAKHTLQGLEQAATLLLRGLRDTDRSVRLSAGHGLDVLILLYGDHLVNPWHSTQKIFSDLYRHMDTARESTKETVLVIVGRMGKTKCPEVLGQVLCFLIAQVGKQNPVIKGLACLQLAGITKHQHKTLYALMLPYLDQIAPFLVSRICSQPGLLSEICKLMSMAPADFISATAPRTYPLLFTSCDVKVIEAVAREVSQKPSAMFLSHSHGILAHILMLPSSLQTTRALNFVVKILTDESQSQTIDLRSIVKSCLVLLLGDLVIAMGDENEQNAKMAIDALGKVERIVNTTAKGGNLPSPELGSFLKNHMLGLVSHINEMLQDVQGKKSISTKRKIIRSLGALIVQIGPAINNVAPQVMATFQTMVSIPELSEATLQSWSKFLSTLGPNEIGPHIGPTSAAIVTSWNLFTPKAKRSASSALSYIIKEIGKEIGRHLDDFVDISSIPELRGLHQHLEALRSNWTPKEKLQRILERSSNDNLSVAVQSLTELKSLLIENQKLVMDLVSGDIFDPIIGHIMTALLNAASRDSDKAETLKALAYECIGIIGAVDPDRWELATKQTRIVVKNNFTDEDESTQFALHLICDLLVGAFRSTSDINYQSHLAYTIQELLKFCQFKPALVGAGTNTSISNKVRNRWKSLPKHILESVTPLLEGKFTLSTGHIPLLQHPIYSHQTTYREWIQLWTGHLISRASGPTAKTIFNVFRSAVRHKDVIVAHHLLPHLVLNILIGPNEEDAQAIRAEMIVVLEDQITNDSHSTSDKKLLSAQAVFMLLDHLNAWVRIVRQDLNAKKIENKRARGDRNLQNTQLEEQLTRVDSILSSIDHHLMARAAFQCKAFARSLMNFERQIRSLQERSPSTSDLSEYYERLHEIYSHLDEPDGMEGISTLILSPSLEHQIREHESTGRWTSAQSCWEVRLQQSPDNVDFHLGLLRCLRNLGHYDTLRTHVRGVLTRKPEWQGALAGFQIESAWMVGAWNDVQSLVQQSTAQSAQMVIGRVLLAMRNDDPVEISSTLANARMILGAPISAAGPHSYRRSYDAVLDLHLIHELDIILHAISRLAKSPPRFSQDRRQVLNDLSRILVSRLDSAIPTFRFRELILSMRRTAFSLSSNSRDESMAEIGRTWLTSAKIARKAGQWQTAYSAMLQAQQSNTKFSFIESAKLTKATGEPLRALQELENSMKLAGLIDGSGAVDLTLDDDVTKMKAKAQILRARWMYESQRFDASLIYRMFQLVTELDKSSESAHFHLGQFHDECFKSLSPADQRGRGLKMSVATVRAYARAMKQGSKYVYQTVPRLLTIWLDLGEGNFTDKESRDAVLKCHEHAAKAIRDVPAYKWYTAFPQIVSRVGHPNPETYKLLSKLILKVLEEYPKQALWLFTSVVKSTKSNREQRGRAILEQLRNNPKLAGTQVPVLIEQSVAMTNQLLAVCDYPIDDERRSLNMRKDFPRLALLGHCDLIIPLQESLTATLPPTSSSQSNHQPFPANLPMFADFYDEIEIMRSLAKPRKISIRGTDGQTYMFLGKPKDDLRKDARLMEFNSIINKLLKANSESRKRQLHIRTYGVVTLNEECGFIQWVPNTIPVRTVLTKIYDGRRIQNWSAEMSSIFKKIKEVDDNTAASLFMQDILPRFPPVFHEWFLETFPEPSAWLVSRLTYGRTAAVMSMVGFILGLGDRHCENILLDANTGDVVHVDFNCLFEKGKTLETPERVPFRLTQNMVDGLGVTGIEGVFRIACEVTLQLLRDNKDSLMSVLDTFIHDPLVEWEDEKRRLDRRHHAKTTIDVLAKNVLKRIERKLKGVYAPDSSKDRSNQEKDISTNNLVQILIQEATDDINLARMYPGWAAWH